MNTYRSAISTTLHLIMDDKLGDHPYVSRCLKGVFVSRPPSPIYSFTWNVSQLTSYLAAQPPVQSLSLKALTLRTVTLCSLVSAQREQTLCSLDLDNMSIYEDEIKFVIGSRTKTSRPGKKPLEVSIPSLPTNLSLCPKQTLLHFVFFVRNTCASQGSRLYLSCSFLMLNHTSLFPHLL